MKVVKLVSHSRTSVAFGLPDRHDFCDFSIEEELVCEVRSCSENFVLRNENIFTFQLTANIEFLEGRR